MAFIVPNVSEVRLLEFIVNKSSPSNWILHLYTNSVTLTESTVLANLTEATQAGYASISLTGASWTITTLSGVTTASFAEQFFTFSVAATIEGYYITDSSSNLLCVEKFSNGPYTLPSGGGQIGITLNVSLD